MGKGGRATQVQPLSPHKRKFEHLTEGWSQIKTICKLESQASFETKKEIESSGVILALPVLDRTPLIVSLMFGSLHFIFLNTKSPEELQSIGASWRYPVFSLPCDPVCYLGVPVARPR